MMEGIMLILRVVYYVVTAVAAYFLINPWFALGMTIVVGVVDAYLYRIQRDRIMPHLLALAGWLLVALVLSLSGAITGYGVPVVICAAVFLALVSARKMHCPWAAGTQGTTTVSEGVCTKILDASILMDGRIVDILDIGFLDGTLVVPRFVVHQIQNVFETGNDLKKQRAKHALDLIRKLQNLKNVQFRVCEIDFPHEKDIDHRIIALALKLKAKIITNDYTLNRVASLQEIDVLNINELANALKPVVLPGETIQVQLLKKGKDPEQAIGYLDDGTMVVIDGGETYIGSRVDASITSVLQNPAGKMIFGRVESHRPHESAGGDEHDA